MPSAAILNGGRSVRFGGCDKGALVVGATTIRERQLAVLAAISDDILIVGGTEPAPRDSRARWIPDRHPGRGPLAGLEAALLHARHPLVVVVACDMPAISAALLARLHSLADGWDAVVPRTGRGYHPLCAVYRVTPCLPVVTSHLAAGDLAVRDLFPALRVREVTEAELAVTGDPRQLLTNVNTPAEHEALATRLAHEPLS